jgi:hypothetical protein
MPPTDWHRPIVQQQWSECATSSSKRQSSLLEEERMFRRALEGAFIAVIALASLSVHAGEKLSLICPPEIACSMGRARM